MRFIVFITVILVFSSCSSLKPAVNKQPENAGARNSQPSSPKFIEHITVNGGPADNKTGGPRPAENVPPAYAATGNSNIEGLAALQFKYSVLMDVPVEQIDNLPLWQYIDDWYGTHYRFGGSTRQGIDCSAFASGLMATVFGIGLPRMAKDQYHTGERVSRNNLQEGDLVFFHTTRKGVSHVGVYLANNKFVHASTNYGVVISDLNDPYYSRAFVGARRERAEAAATNN